MGWDKKSFIIGEFNFTWGFLVKQRLNFKERRVYTFLKFSFNSLISKIF